MSRKMEREVIDTLRRAGIEVQRGGFSGTNHRELFVVRGNATARVYVATTPRCDVKQACNNVLQQARRALRADGADV